MGALLFIRIRAGRQFGESDVLVPQAATSYLFRLASGTDALTRG